MEALNGTRYDQKAAELWMEIWIAYLIGTRIINVGEAAPK
jgi:hypothetical protein